MALWDSDHNFHASLVLKFCSRKHMVGIAKSAAYWFMLCGGACLLGFGGGNAFIYLQSRISAREANSDLMSFLESTISGIEVGSVFPEFPVWSTDDGSGVFLSELLPEGGIILFLSSGCVSCNEIMTQIAHEGNLAEKLSDKLVIVVDGNVEPLIRFTDSLNLEFGVYQDIERHLSLNHQVRAFPAFFCPVSDRFGQKS